MTKPTWVKQKWVFKHHEMPPYRTISNSKEDKLEQIHYVAAVRLGSTVAAFCLRAPRLLFLTLPAREISTRYAREFSFTRCHGEADSGMLHGSAVGNTSRTGCAFSPAAEICGKIFAFNIERKKVAACCD